MIKPISPAEAAALQPSTIPPVVYEVVNRILAQHAATGSISFTQAFETRKEAVEREIFLQRALKVVQNPLYANAAVATGRPSMLGDGPLRRRCSPRVDPITQGRSREPAPIW